MNTLQREQLEEKVLTNLIDKAQEAIEQADEIVCDRLNSSEYASEDFKQAQRFSNAIHRINNAIEAAKYEL